MSTSVIKNTLYLEANIVGVKLIIYDDANAAKYKIIAIILSSNFSNTKYNNAVINNITVKHTILGAKFTIPKLKLFGPALMQLSMPSLITCAILRCDISPVYGSCKYDTLLNIISIGNILKIVRAKGIELKNLTILSLFFFQMVTAIIPVNTHIKMLDEFIN